MRRAPSGTSGIPRKQGKSSMVSLATVRSSPKSLRIVAAFAAVYVIWGSTYFAIALAIGGLLLVGGNGGVVFAEQYIPSGLAALVVAMVPIYIVLLDWLRPGGRPPTALVALGLVFGFSGIFLLIGPDAIGGGASYFP